MNPIQVTVPDIGDFSDVPVIEVLVKPGDTVKAEDALVTLESDKATMDVPSPGAGTVKEVLLKVGDKVRQGTLVLTLETVNAATPAAAPAIAPAAPATAAPAPTGGATLPVTVPDIGDFTDVPVIEVLVKPGDTVKAEDALITLESDKATMDVPSPAAGVVKAVALKVGDKVSQGALVLTLEVGEALTTKSTKDTKKSETPAAPPSPAVLGALGDLGGKPSVPTLTAPAGRAHASPSVRRFARELGVDVSRVPGTGPKGRITQEDVQNFVKGVMVRADSGAAAAPAGGGLDLLPWPKVDFAKFGPITTQPLSRIKKISGQNLSRNWVMIPAVTYHEDADITDLEAFRVQFNKENEKAGVKVTMLAFLIKAAVAALKKFPEFNSSLDGDNLVLKQYFHIAFAADTPNGLVVPVVKDADKKGIVEIGQETATLAKLAREGKLKPADMQGACFTISSLGGIGGTYFAPIINAPEVAILGVNKSAMKPVWDGKQFVPRLTLPLSLTADHRVIDGAMATRFNAYVADLLGDMRRVLM
jgi:pyruvate dehydrogenase E2 component (dihydrolipoamide acetyltransferase)